MASAQEQLKAEEGKLRKLAAWRPRGPVAEIEAQTEKLRATAENVELLRAELAPPKPPVTEPLASARLAALAGRRQFEAEQKAKAVERKRREPARKAARKLLAFAHAELAGASLNVERLREAEGVELLALVEERYDGELSGRKLKRYERLVGTLAGEPALFERKRKEAEADAAEALEAERARLEAMPVRRYEGKGGIYLPAFLHSWLMGSAEGLNVTDLGVLAAILFGIEHGRSPFHRSHVTDGAIVLDAGAGYQLLTCLNPDLELGAGRVLEAVEYLRRNDWLEIDRSDGRTRIRLGERARRQLAEAASAVT